MMHHSNSNGNTSFSTIYQQSMTSFSYYNHETPNPHTTNMQSTMEKSSHKNGQFHATDAGDRFNNSHVILQTNCLTRKRSSKKDRHRKINTARGPRDRRMRLSIDVAKKFFKLQDMLGFDKASNTVEWLLMNSQSAIRDLHPQQLNQSCSLKGALSSSSSDSECEVMSLVDRSLAKETRARARARARKRATEKRNIKFGCDGEGSDQCANLGPGLDRVVDRTTNRLEPSIPFGVPLTDGAEYPSSYFQFKQGIVGDNSSMMLSNWSPSFLFNYQHNLGQSHEHQFSDFDILGKPWVQGINN